MADLDAVEGRIWSILAPYREELEEATIYGMPSLRWDQWPEALDGSSEEFRKRRTGKATFSFPSLDDAMAAELEAFLARLYRLYRAHHAGRSGPPVP